MRQVFPDLETPCLLIEETRMGENLRSMQELANRNGVKLRPHVKSHKSISLAQRQMATGAIGVAVAKLSEAEVMVAGGIRDIQIANQIVGDARIARLVELNRQARVSCAIDCVENARQLSEAFISNGSRLSVLIEVDSGLNRAGVRGIDALEALYRAALAMPGLAVLGILTHAGHVYGADSIDEVERIGVHEGGAMAEFASTLRKVGLAVETVSVGSTPTARFAAVQVGVTELRVGNYIFNDRIQIGLGCATRENCALTVLATITSHSGTQAVIDAGSKAFTSDTGAHGNVRVAGYGETPDGVHQVTRLSEEHGIVPDLNQKLALGRRIRVIPNHACPVLNLFDRAYIVDGEQVREEVRIDARGCSQ
jgi:D-serine deaminase-like pyridoxal phosphate-dependent protein